MKLLLIADPPASHRFRERLERLGAKVEVVSPQHRISAIPPSVHFVLMMRAGHNVTASVASMCQKVGARLLHVSGSWSSSAQQLRPVIQAIIEEKGADEVRRNAGLPLTHKMQIPEPKEEAPPVPPPPPPPPEEKEEPRLAPLPTLPTVPDSVANPGPGSRTAEAKRWLLDGGAKLDLTGGVEAYSEWCRSHGTSPIARTTFGSLRHMVRKQLGLPSDAGHAFGVPLRVRDRQRAERVAFAKEILMESPAASHSEITHKLRERFGIGLDSEILTRLQRSALRRARVEAPAAAPPPPVSAPTPVLTKPDDADLRAGIQLLAKEMAKLNLRSLTLEVIPGTQRVKAMWSYEAKESTEVES